MQIDLSRFKDTYFQETEEHLASMEAGLLRLSESGTDAEALNDVFRCAHSIKGASGMFGFDEIARFTHSLENLLDRMREGSVSPTPERTTLLLQALDVLQCLVGAARSGSPVAVDTNTVLQRLRDSESGFPDVQVVQPAATNCNGQCYCIHFAPSPDTFRQGMDPVLVLRELAARGKILSIEMDQSRLPSLAELNPETCYLAWNIRMHWQDSPEELRDVFAFAEDGAEITIQSETETATVSTAPIAPGDSQAPASAASAKQATAASIRVPTQKIDRLIDLMSELMIAHSMAAQVVNNFGPGSLGQLREVFESLERHMLDMQERVMGIRMLPIGTICGRFQRLVRDLSSATGKMATLEVIGADTELDKCVLEGIADPLTHLIRNSIDHGIEAPEERLKAGKTRDAVVRIRAYHQAGNIIIEVGDDGRGLDLARIKDKAIRNNLISSVDDLSAEQLQNLIFEPGFSTAATISDLSGRGVGMDVVKRNVDGLNGSVSVASTWGRGTTITITLPLTLAMLEGLLLRVGAQTYVLPLVSILESIRPSRQQLSTPGGRGEVVMLRSEPIPLLRLHRLFGIQTEIADPTMGLVVIVEHQSRRAALLVDELLGQQQFVIKSLETHFRKVDGIVGATILGDGQAALILDVAGLTDMAGKAGNDK